MGKMQKGFALPGRPLHRAVARWLVLLSLLQGLMVGEHMLWHAEHQTPAESQFVASSQPCEQCRILAGLSAQLVAPPMAVTIGMESVPQQVVPRLPSQAALAPRAAARAPPSQPA